MFKLKEVNLIDKIRILELLFASGRSAARIEFLSKHNSEIEIGVGVSTKGSFSVCATTIDIGMVTPELPDKAIDVLLVNISSETLSSHKIVCPPLENLSDLFIVNDGGKKPPHHARFIKGHIRSPSKEKKPKKP